MMMNTVYFVVVYNQIDMSSDGVYIYKVERYELQLDGKDCSKILTEMMTKSVVRNVFVVSDKVQADLLYRSFSSVPIN